MNPVIAAWLEYRRLAYIQPSYFRAGYGNWVAACQRAFSWYNEVAKESK